MVLSHRRSPREGAAIDAVMSESGPTWCVRTVGRPAGEVRSHGKPAQDGKASHDATRQRAECKITCPVNPPPFW
eukprot:14077645-Alexandrium_andersonii.AAC.1